ncbi:COP1-interacting protein 7 isoform X2 [Beta vulgaris subsp. vulgaris]|uniref:COP1-interacting protein 7 isoform X2 n=1 Tax=Beta vulgaris subsp. vulgaris TaxID=3555 RepID=UPI002036676E|nr:COP1-interacting protein 7 isoform X2 [Beta vulgaris subsp. vulgaris]
MKSSTRLDSIVFQLTPTRTRCDLVITANGKSEKIASGLLNPFLAHLKAAEEQIGKGGYSIVLEPKHGSDASWFIKGTVERFVRFVSSPEILERVYTIESEILQIEKAICVQNTNDNGLHTVEDFPVKSEERLEGSKQPASCNDEKAIVLYQPASNQSEEDASTTTLEKSSKVQLVQVLETRKTVLQKEQGMAFARAVAAGFDIDNIAALLAFAERFGASRLIDACKKFLDLWKAKHESGQWVEVEATEAMSCRSDLPSTNAAGIVFLNPSEQRDFKESCPQGESPSEKKGTSCANDQVQPNPQEYSPGQFPHPMFPPWQMHPQANGMPVFQPYPMQGMPYYQNYMGQNPYFQPPYSPHDDSRAHPGRKSRQRRHSMDSRDMSGEFESQELDSSGKRMQDDLTDEEDSASKKSKNRTGKSSRKQSKTVVIRNINYITSAKQGSSDSDSQSCSDSGSNDEGRNAKFDETKKLKKKGAYLKSDDPLISNSKEGRMSGQAGDDGHWQAFQSFLLTDADESSNSKVRGGKRQSAIGDDASALGMHSIGENHDVDMGESLDVSEGAMCRRRTMDDRMLSYGQDANFNHGESQKDLQYMEAGGRRGSVRRSVDPDMAYVINRQEKLTDVWDPSLDPVIRNGFQGTSNTNNKGSLNDISDESLMVLQRPGSLAGDGRKAMDMDCELPLVLRKTDDRTANYEPNELNLLPNRVIEDRSSGYDPAMDFETQDQFKDASKLSGKKKEVAIDAKGGPRKAIRDQKLKAEKRTTVGTKREKPSKLSPAEDARARAEKLRAYKADLQKLKKEKEQEQAKRLEALKIERQKRIAAKSGAHPAQSPLSSQQAKKPMPKLSPVSQKGSKFSDTEPGSSSPLQRSTIRILSKVSPDSSKTFKSGRLNIASHTNENKLTRSASSLRMRKEEKDGSTPDSKATMSRIRRLSEPKGTVHQIPSGKSRSAELASRHKVSEKPELKKMPAKANVDKAKSSDLPELKIRTSKAFSVTVPKKSTKEKLNDNNFSSGLASANLSRKSANIPPPMDVDDSTVVEKTVVMLECEKPSAPVLRAPEDKIGVRTMQSDAYNQAGKSEEDAAVPPPASPIVVKEIDHEASIYVVNRPSHTRLDEKEKVSSNLHSVETPGKPYEAPYARVSSLEDPCMTESNYGKAPPTRIEMASTGMQTTTVHVANTQRTGLVNVSEADSGKSQGKEPSRGFRKLFKFGKNSAASERYVESDKATLDGSVVDDNALNGSSSEVFTVKNLLSQEESSSAGTTPKKSSRPFSLLSHFRSKTSEKKLAT